MGPFGSLLELALSAAGSCAGGDFCCCRCLRNAFASNPDKGTARTRASRRLSSSRRKKAAAAAAGSTQQRQRLRRRRLHQHRCRHHRTMYATAMTFGRRRRCTALSRSTPAPAETSSLTRSDFGPRPADDSGTTAQAAGDLCCQDRLHTAIQQARFFPRNLSRAIFSPPDALVISLLVSPLPMLPMLLPWLLLWLLLRRGDRHRQQDRQERADEHQFEDRDLSRDWPHQRRRHREGQGSAGDRRGSIVPG